jgi:hypothetical protein
MSVDKAVLVPTVILGLLLVGIYLIRCWRGSRVYSLSILISIVLFAGGVIAGGLLVARPLLPYAVVARLVGLELYVWIGGLAVLAVSIQAIYREIFKKR